MTTNPAPGRTRGPGLAIALLVVAAGAAYAGMRWHSTLERWLVPGAGSTAAAGASGEPNAGPGAKQLWTCGMHPQVIQDHPGDCPICHMKLTPLGAGAASDSGGVVVDPAVVQNMGVRTFDVAEGTLPETLRLAATIAEPETGRVDVNLRVSGWIQTLYAATEGMEVRKGDPLFDLYSPDLRLAVEELIAARKAEASGGAVPGLSLAAAAESRLEALGLSKDQIAELGGMDHAPEFIKFLSPLDGHVTDKMDLYSGSAVMPGQRVLRLSQRAAMWAEGRIHERDLAAVRTGLKATVRVDALPGRTFEGVVTFVHPHLDPMTRTGLVRVAIDNPGGLLRDAMFATMTLDVGSDDRTPLAPREAVIDSGDAQIVLIALPKGRFEPRRVTVGRSGAGGLVQLLSGVKPGEKVVASGHFLLDSESRLREAVSKFLGAKPDPTEAPIPALNLVLPAEKVDAAVAAYLPLAETLGAVQTPATAIDPGPLAAALRALGDGGSPGAGRFIAAVAAAAEALQGQPLDRQRELFKKLSAEMITLVEAAPPSPAVADALFVVNCPMAPGDWLQRTREVANPYYAEEMKACGSVLRPVGKKGEK